MYCVFGVMVSFRIKMVVGLRRVLIFKGDVWVY